MARSSETINHSAGRPDVARLDNESNTMNDQWDFQLTTRIQFGRGRLESLGTIARELGSKAMLVGYRDRTGLEPVYAKASAVLGEAGVAVTEFFEIPPDPDAALGKQGAKRAAEAAADVIIGLGGGSAIDAAKGIALLVKSGGELWDYTGANSECRPVIGALPVVAVPTTAGTGTEVSPIAVFTHPGVGKTSEHPIKASISSPLICPKVALVDPQLTVGSPRRLTAACGADALGHAIEACMSRRANPVSWALAGKAVRLIVENLAQAVEHPDDPAPREPVALAATLAGAAFSFAGVVMTHAVAQAMGAVLHVPHGEAVAIATPLSLRYNAEHCVEQYARLAEECGITAASREQQAGAFVERIIALLQTMGFSETIDAAGADANTLADELARSAVESTPVPLELNPRPIDQATLVELLREMIH